MMDKNNNNNNSSNSSSLLTQPSVYRRNVLAVLGITAVAGCSDVVTNENSNDSDTQTKIEDTDDSDTQTKVEEPSDPPAVTPAGIISQHLETLLDLSYTFIINYQGEGSATSDIQEIKYRYDHGQNIAAFEQETTIDDGWDRLSQLYSDNDVVANIMFEDDEPITLTIREGESEYEQLTGESVFDYYLLGSELDESHEEEQPDDDGTLTVYELVSHRFFDSLDGVIKVDNQNLIRQFHFEWLDAQNEDHWIKFDLVNVDDTTIDVDSEFNVDT